MTDKSVDAIVKAVIQTQIVAALTENDNARLIEDLVASALCQEVNEHGGKPDSWSRKRMPFLDWLVADHIRLAATNAVRLVIEERKPEIEAAVRKIVSADKLVDGMMDTLLGALNRDYSIKIKFANEQD